VGELGARAPLWVWGGGVGSDREALGCALTVLLSERASEHTSS
jgi:hypothetical protein